MAGVGEMVRICRIELAPIRLGDGGSRNKSVGLELQVNDLAGGN